MATRYRKRSAVSDEDSEDWLLTYSDAVTLLMTFLVLMLSVSTIDQAKYEQVVESIKEKGLDQDKQYVSPFETLQEKLNDVAKEHDMEKNMTVTRQPKGLTIELASSSLYTVGSADIQDAALAALSDVASSIKGFDYDNYQVEIEGHTDNVAINTERYPSNWELSVHRATNVVRHFLQSGIDNDRIKVAGYADTRPKVPNQDVAGNAIPGNQAINRRVVIHVVRKED
ncbi:MAG: OmpA family protein [Gammaproteobacteria bacterium]|nr:OmpA family protein [Gammaproteobacteria bacterium]